MSVRFELNRDNRFELGFGVNWNRNNKYNKKRHEIASASIFACP